MFYQSNLFKVVELSSINTSGLQTAKDVEGRIHTANGNNIASLHTITQDVMISILYFLMKVNMKYYDPADKPLDK